MKKLVFQPKIVKNQVFSSNEVRNIGKTRKNGFPERFFLQIAKKGRNMVQIIGKERKMGIRRAEVEKFAQEHGIELRINDPKDYLLEITEFRKNYSNHGRAGYPPDEVGTGINHVHAYTKTGEIFGGIDLHNMSVWDCDCAVAINWADVLADMCDHMPVPCPLCLANGGAGCEVCDDEPDEAEIDRIIEEKEMAFRNEVDAELLAEIQEKGGTL